MEIEEIQCRIDKNQKMISIDATTIHILKSVDERLKMNTMKKFLLRRLRGVRRVHTRLSF